MFVLKIVPFSPPDISESEIEEVVKVLRSGWITTGPETKKFEHDISEYIGVDNVVCLSSATAAMEFTLRILGIGPGDEVITTAYTYTASASVINHVGAKIVLIDVATESFEMDYDKIADAITEHTKAIIPVDIAGRLCDYGKIFEAVKEKQSLFRASNSIQKTIGRIAVISDSAHGFGSSRNGIMSGNYADFTCFSFHAVKNLTTAEGGAVVWNHKDGIDDDELYHDYMLYSLHGQNKDALKKNTAGSWEYDILHLGYKNNMTDIQAAIGVKQLERYDSMLKIRRKLVERYDSVFKPLGAKLISHFDDECTSNGHLYLARFPITLEQRNEIINICAERGIGLNVHYKPLPMMTAYKNLGFDIGDYPNAYNQYKNEITFPLYSRLSDEDQQYVIDVFTEVYEQVVQNNSKK